LLIFQNQLKNSLNLFVISWLLIKTPNETSFSHNVIATLSPYMQICEGDIHKYSHALGFGKMLVVLQERSLDEGYYFIPAGKK